MIYDSIKKLVTYALEHYLIHHLSTGRVLCVAHLFNAIA